MRHIPLRRLILALAMLLPAVLVQAQVEKRQKSFGLRTGYVTLNKSASAGLEFEYAVSRHFVLAPGIDYIFRNNNIDGALLNLDYHGPWPLTSDGRCNFYHILGINYASWSTHTRTYGEQPAGPVSATANDDDVTTRFNRVGLDFGAGISWYARPTLRLSVQGKFNWLKGHNTGLFNAGISYIF